MLSINTLIKVHSSNAIMSLFFLPVKVHLQCMRIYTDLQLVNCYLSKSLSFISSLTHAQMGGCCHAGTDEPHWEQFRVHCLAQGHFKHAESWARIWTTNLSLINSQPALQHSHISEESWELQRVSYLGSMLVSASRKVDEVSRLLCEGHCSLLASSRKEEGATWC